MSAHITPLTRNQLLEVELCIRNAVQAINHAIATPALPKSPVPSHPPRNSLGAEEPHRAKPSPALGVSINEEPDEVEASVKVGPAAQSLRGAPVSASRPLPPPPTIASSSPPTGPSQEKKGSVKGAECGKGAEHVKGASGGVDHPLLHGRYCDVFHDSLTRGWRLYDKLLYVVWWSHRPVGGCGGCGMADAWMPSGEAEMYCAQCGTEAGSTRLNDIVEDVQHNGNDDSDGEDEAHWFHDDSGGAGATAASAAGALSVTNAISGYAFFYDWLQRLEAVCAGYERGDCAGGLRVELPTGENLPTVLRAAFDMARVLTLPGIRPHGLAVTRAAALYLSLVLHRYAVPFPLFCMADDRRQGAAQALEDANGEALQWVDVALHAKVLGVGLPDFFESTRLSTQFTTNVMTLVAASFAAAGSPAIGAVPSVLWHPDRVAGRGEEIRALRPPPRSLPAKGSLRAPKQSAGARSTDVGPQSGIGARMHPAYLLPELCPEEVAMAVVLELARRVDARPIAAVATTAAAAAQHARRVGQWLDAMAVYPRRRVYRDAAVEPSVETTLHTRSAAQDSEENGSDPLSWWSEASPVFLQNMELLFPTSLCANTLLHVMAHTFHLTPLALADLVVGSGIYQGPTRVREVIIDATRRGLYHVMPLYRRRSPLSSVWWSVYLALHSSDRLILLAALRQLSDRRNHYNERLAELGRVVQRMLRKHQSTQWYQIHYTLNVTDPAERHLNGLYGLTALSMRGGGLAVFTCLRSGRKTITFNTANGRLSLNYVNAKAEKVVEGLQAEAKGPVLVAIESDSARAVVTAVLEGAVGQEEWGAVVWRLDRGAQVRRRMQVPMLASRLAALGSIGEDARTASRARPGDGTETENLLSMPPGLDAVRLREELGEVLFLPQLRPSFLLGLSDSRVVALYAALVAFLEFVDTHRRRLVATTAKKEAAKKSQPTSNPGMDEKAHDEGSTHNNNSSTDDNDNDATPAVGVNTWIEELLQPPRDEEGEEEESRGASSSLERSPGGFAAPYLTVDVPAGPRGEWAGMPPKGNRRAPSRGGGAFPQTNATMSSTIHNNNNNNNTATGGARVLTMTPISGPRAGPVVGASIRVENDDINEVGRGGKGGEAVGHDPLPPLRLSESTAAVAERRRRSHPLSNEGPEEGGRKRSLSTAATTTNALVREYLECTLPPYWEVLMHHNQDESRRRGKQSPWENEIRKDLVRGGGPKGGNLENRGPIASPHPRKEEEGGAGMVSTKASVQVGVFCLFDAGECRRRLQRMVHFVNVYRQKKEWLLALAKEECGRAQLRAALVSSTYPPPPALQKLSKPTRSQKPTTGKRRVHHSTAALESAEGNSRKAEEFPSPSSTSSKPAVTPRHQQQQQLQSQTTPVRVEQGRERRSLTLSPLALPHANACEEAKRTPNQPRRSSSDRDEARRKADLALPPPVVRNGSEGEGEGRRSNERKRAGSVTPGSHFSEDEEAPASSEEADDNNDEEDDEEEETWGDAHLGPTKTSPPHAREKLKKSGRRRRRMAKRMERKRVRYDDGGNGDNVGVGKSPEANTTAVRTKRPLPSPPVALREGNAARSPHAGGNDGSSGLDCPNV